MPEFMGTESSVALQRRLRDRQREIDRSPHLVNGGRILHILAPEKTGWGRVRELAEEDGLVGFPVVSPDETIRMIKDQLGAHWEPSVFDALLGDADRVLGACATVIDAVGLPGGWRTSMQNCPDEQQIAEVQALNAETGVSPYPAYYRRSEVLPVLTACIRDDQGKLVATASVADRYHRDSRLGGHVFAGMVSVSDENRGRGLGKLINALALVESQRRFGWRVATEQVAADNAVSRSMILACGLDPSRGLTSITATAPDAGFTR